MRGTCFVACLLAVVPAWTTSQRLPPSLLRAESAQVPSARQSAPPAAEPGFGRPFWTAAGLGLLGWGIGALAGHVIQGDCFDDFCEVEGIFYGGAAGGGLGLAVGAHLGNRRRGSFVLDLVASGAVWGLGYALMRSFADGSDDTGVLLTAIVLPPTQLLATVLVERATGRARDRSAPAP